MFVANYSRCINGMISTKINKKLIVPNIYV